MIEASLVRQLTVPLNPSSPPARINVEISQVATSNTPAIVGSDGGLLVVARPGFVAAVSFFLGETVKRQKMRLAELKDVAHDWILVFKD